MLARSVACCLDKPFTPLLATPVVSCTVSDVLVRRESGGMVRPPIEVRVAIIGNVDRSVCLLIMAGATGGGVQEATGQKTKDRQLLFAFHCFQWVSGCCLERQKTGLQEAWVREEDYVWVVFCQRHKLCMAMHRGANAFKAEQLHYD